MGTVGPCMVGGASAGRRPAGLPRQRSAQRKGWPMMAQARIPIDLLNPGQVFACLGFLEAADVLLGDAEGGFDWTDAAKPQFLVRAAGAVNPVEEVLAFLADARLELWTPKNYSEKGNGRDDEAAPIDVVGQALDPEVFPSSSGDRMSLP